MIKLEFDTKSYANNSMYYASLHLKAQTMFMFSIDLILHLNLRIVKS